MSSEDKWPKAGEMFVLLGLPPGFLEDLPLEDQIAIKDMIGKPIQFNEITRTSTWERVELEFFDYERGMGHFLYVDPSFIRPVTEE